MQCGSPRSLTRLIVCTAIAATLHSFQTTLNEKVARTFSSSLWDDEAQIEMPSFLQELNWVGVLISWVIVRVVYSVAAIVGAMSAVVSALCNKNVPPLFIWKPHDANSSTPGTHSLSKDSFGSHSVGTLNHSLSNHSFGKRSFGNLTTHSSSMQTLLPEVNMFSAWVFYCGNHGTLTCSDTRSCICSLQVALVPNVLQMQ